MRKRLVTFFSHLVFLLIVVGCEGDPAVFNTIPEFDYVYSSLHETGIGATLYCGLYIPDETQIDNYDYGFILNDNNDLSSSSAVRIKATLSSKPSRLTADASNLAPDRNYYYAAYVSLGRQELRSQTYYFRTGQTQQSINISFKNDVIYSVNEGLNTKTVQEAGFCWSTVQEVPTIFDNVINADLKSEGSFSAAIPEDWKQNVQYFVRAYIETADNCIQYSNSISVRKQGDDPAEDEKFIEIENDLYEIGSAAGIFSTWVSRNVEIQVSSDVDWIEQLSTKAVSTDSLSFLVFRNDTGEEREGHLLLDAIDGSVSKTITIIQSGYEEDMNIRFADNVFKSYMVEHFDIDKDGGISEEEAALVEEIETVTDDISSLAGLEYCTNLKKLVCHGSQPGLGQLNALNISKNSVLEYIDCSNNNISSLSVNENKNLKELICANNRLAGLYVNKAQALEVIDCRNNVLEYVDISNLSNLRTLICSRNRMKILNTEQNTALSYLDCSNNNLTELDLSENSSLTALYCNNNSIKEILVCKNSDKWEDSNFVKDDEAIFIDMYQPVSIPDPYFKEYLVQNFDSDADGEISRKEALSVTSIAVYTENITSLKGIEYFTNLSDLLCEIHYTSKSSSGELSYNDIPVDRSQLSEIDVSHNVNLQYLRCCGNSISRLDLSQNVMLKHLDCSYNNLQELDIAKNTKLLYLDCMCNHLVSIDISCNILLTSLYCWSNPLLTLDVSNNVALTHLDCSYNQLAMLDVSNNPKLTSLSCSSNQFTSLDVSNNPNLTSLSCSSNQLTSLDISNNPKLTYLYCWSTQLSTLDVSNNTALKTLWCDSNPALTELWMAKEQQIEDLMYNSSITTIKYK